MSTRKSRLRQKAKTSDNKKTKSNLYDPKKPLGFALKKCEVVKVTPESAAMWNGVVKGMIVTMVDGNPCDNNTVMVLLKGAKKAGKKFRITFEIPQALADKQKGPAAKAKDPTPAVAANQEEEKDGKPGTTEVRRQSIRQPRKGSELDLWPTDNPAASQDEPAPATAQPAAQQAAPPVNTSAFETRIAELEAENEALKKKVAQLELANKELTAKEIATRVAFRDMDMKKSSKIATYERQLRTMMAKRQKRGPPPKKQPLGVISEEGAMSPRQLAEQKKQAGVPTGTPDHSRMDSLAQPEAPPYMQHAESVVSVDVYYREPEKREMQDMWKIAKADMKSGKERPMSMSTDLADALDGPLNEDGPFSGPFSGGRHESGLQRTYSDTPTEWTEVTVDVPGGNDSRGDLFSPHFDGRRLSDADDADDDRATVQEDEQFDMGRQNSYGELPGDDDNQTIVSRGDSVIVLSNAEIKRREAARASNPNPAAEAFKQASDDESKADGDRESEPDEDPTAQVLMPTSPVDPSAQEAATEKTESPVLVEKKAAQAEDAPLEA